MLLMLVYFIPSSLLKLYTTIFYQIYLQFTSFGKWRIDWIFIPIQHSFVNCRWCIFVDILYIMIAYSNMMKASTSQLILLQIFGKIGVFIKMRKTFRNNLKWETVMFLLVCWKLHYVAEKWKHRKVARSCQKVEKKKPQ